MVRAVAAPDDTPVVLIHGWAGSFARTWHEPGIDALLADAGRPVIGVDLLGHGDAPKPHDPQAYADLTGRVAQALPPDGSVDAVGFSLGASTLMRLAARTPERFRKLVLAGIGDTALGADPGRSEQIAEAVEGKTDPDDLTLARFAAYGNEDGNDPVALAACMRRPTLEPITPELLARITAPVLVALGDRDGDGAGERLAAAFPNGTFVRLRNTDHFATPESFAFIDAALRFLDG
jgi:pimeloyl-ACP methyl ester carboxylesterase